MGDLIWTCVCKVLLLFCACIVRTNESPARLLAWRGFVCFDWLRGQATISTCGSSQPTGRCLTSLPERAAAGCFVPQHSIFATPKPPQCNLLITRGSLSTSHIAHSRPFLRPSYPLSALPTETKRRLTKPCPSVRRRRRLRMDVRLLVRFAENSGYSAARRFWSARPFPPGPADPVWWWRATCP